MTEFKTYGRPAQFLPTQAVPVQSIPLLASTAPPLLPQDLPPLPSKHRRPAPGIDAFYELTTHLVPAAYPRITPFVPNVQPPAWSADKDIWTANVEKATEEVFRWKRMQHDGNLPTGEGHGSRKVLWNAVNRYARKGPRPRGHGTNTGKPLALFFSHANGFHKETWEPTIAHLLAANDASEAPLDIAEIWSWEAVNHGDSYLVNTDNLGGIYDWADQSRDIVNFLASYLPSSPNLSSESLPTHLSRLPENLAASRKTFGFQQRTLVVIAHSFSGCATVIAAANHPNLLSSLILVDPVLRPLRPGLPVFLKQKHIRSASGAIRRRANWPSRQEALKQFLATPFFAAWDPAALDLYVECGLYDDPRGGVSLKTPGIHEAIVFAEAARTYEAWQLTPLIDVRIPLKFVMPDNNPENEIVLKSEMPFLRLAHSTNVIIPNAGHLITQEAPKLLAEVCHKDLLHHYAHPRSRL